MKNLEFGDTYLHFKGGRYMVLTTATSEANRNDPKFVIYANIKNFGLVWARREDVWSERIDLGVDTVPRFQYVGTPLWAKVVRKIIKGFVKWKR